MQCLLEGSSGPVPICLDKPGAPLLPLMASFTWFLFLAPVLPQPWGPLQALLPTALLLG